MQVPLIFVFCSFVPVLAEDTATPQISISEKLIQQSTTRLIELQESDGAWPYEGVYRVRRQIPVGYRIGGTAIVCESLLYASESAPAFAAIERGVEVILKDLEDLRMRADTSNRYDVRVWGHIYGLDLFCRLRSIDRFRKLCQRTDPWVPRLVTILLKEQISDGRWNYANQQRHASFVTAPAVQALLLARQQGENVPAEVFAKARTVLLASRTESGAFQYSGTVGRRPTALPGSIARSAVCESTLILLGEGNVDHLRHSINAFHRHWDELEKRRKKTGTHVGPYNVAPYYFYYGHRYLGQAIQFLPPGEQAAEIEKFTAVLMRTRDADDTWNDRIFDRSKAYGTAMSVLALINNVPVPNSLESNGTD